MVDNSALPEQGHQRKYAFPRRFFVAICCTNREFPRILKALLEEAHITGVRQR